MIVRSERVIYAIAVTCMLMDASFTYSDCMRQVIMHLQLQSSVIEALTLAWVCLQHACHQA